MSGKTTENSTKDTGLRDQGHTDSVFHHSAPVFSHLYDNRLERLFLESLLTLKFYYFLFLMLNIKDVAKFNDLITTNGKLYFSIKLTH